MMDGIIKVKYRFLKSLVKLITTGEGILVRLDQIQPIRNPVARSFVIRKKARISTIWG
jgi:hypothetical protein